MDVKNDFLHLNLQKDKWHHKITCCLATSMLFVFKNFADYFCYSIIDIQMF